MKLSAQENTSWRASARKSRVSLMIFTFAAACALSLASFAHADEWVTPKKPKHGYKLLGRVILNVEIRADGTVKRAWPAAASVRSRAAWRAAKAAQTLTFRRGSERTVRMPVTVYLD